MKTNSIEKKVPQLGLYTTVYIVYENEVESVSVIEVLENNKYKVKLSSEWGYVEDKIISLPIDKIYLTREDAQKRTKKHKKLKTTFCAILISICCLIPTIFYGWCIVNSVRFNRDCVGYLELAANANSIEIAEERLTTAIEYLEANNLTNGDCKWFISNKPENNITLWYENLKSARNQLQETMSNPSATELEKSNILMKLRETLYDGECLSMPTGLWQYPNQTLILTLKSTIWMLYLSLAYPISKFF